MGTCATAIPITPGQTVQGNTAEGGSNQNGSCVGVEEGPGAPEIVYSFTLERRQLVTVTMETTGNFDGTLYLRAACEEGESEVVCNDDDGDTSHSRLSAPLDPGTYYVFADGFGRNRGRFSLTLQAADVPSTAEVCQNATALPPNTPVTGQLSNQDHDIFHARCGGNARGPERVYSLAVPRESRLQLHAESDFDAVIHVRRACADANSELACNDDAEDIQHARLNTVLQEGTYYVFADGFHANAAGNYTLEADLAPIAGGSTPGDTCADAVPLTPGTAVEGNTLQAHDDLASPCGAPQEGYDVVYRLEVPNRARARVWFEQSDLGQQGTITVVRDCAQIANAREQCRAGAVGEQGAFDQVLDAGTYFVVVDSAQPRAFGRFRLNARLEDAALAERLCRTAPLHRLRPRRHRHHQRRGPLSGLLRGRRAQRREPLPPARGAAVGRPHRGGVHLAGLRPGDLPPADLRHGEHRARVQRRRGRHAPLAHRDDPGARALHRLRRRVLPEQPRVVLAHRHRHPAVVPFGKRIAASCS